MSAVLPNAFAGLNGLFNTTVSESKILTNPFLKIAIPNSYYRHNLQVLSFRADIIQGTDSTFTHANGYQLSQEQLKLIRQLNPGDEIYFSDIRVSCASSRIGTAPPFWIRIE